MANYHPYFELLRLDWKYHLERARYLNYENAGFFLQSEHLDEMPAILKELPRQALDLLVHILVTDTSKRSVDEKMTAYYLAAEQTGENAFCFCPQKMSYKLTYLE